MTARPGTGEAPGVPDPTDDVRSAGSPAVVLTAAAGLVGLLLALNPAAFAVSLFFSATSLAALPMALADRPGARRLRFALLGAASAALALALVLVPLLGGQAQREQRAPEPDSTGVQVPDLPGPAATRAPPP